jgi:DNA-binding SARP family transcriptional activator
LEYRVLGEVAVARDGESVDLAARQRGLLALLLIDANRVVSTDRIIDELWDDTGQDRQNALWVVISRLRGLLEPDRPKRTDGSILVTRPPGYMLVVDPESVDSFRFDSLAREGRSLIDADPHAASLVLSEALALWRGHAFEEFTYAAFAEAEIARLTELRLATVEDRIAADLAAGRCRDVVSELESLVRQHPEREPARRGPSREPPPR